MKYVALILALSLSGCASKTDDSPFFTAETSAFYVSAVFQALWFDAPAEPPSTYPTGIKTVDEILDQIPPEHRQPTLTKTLVRLKSHAR